MVFIGNLGDRKGAQEYPGVTPETGPVKNENLHSGSAYCCFV